MQRSSVVLVLLREEFELWQSLSFTWYQRLPEGCVNFKSQFGFSTRIMYVACRKSMTCNVEQCIKKNPPAENKCFLEFILSIIKELKK